MLMFIVKREWGSFSRGTRSITKSPDYIGSGIFSSSLSSSIEFSKDFLGPLNNETRVPISRS